jgi:hypothetical protein
LGYVKGGGHLWVFLNWALGLRALGCRVIWLEMASPNSSARETQVNVAVLKSRLERYGLADSVALYSESEELLPRGGDGYLDLEAASEADLLLNVQYRLPPEVVERFRRSALIDIDPGLLQIWRSKRWINLARHDVYFTTGETVGQPGSRVPDAGLRWLYASPCVALDWWPLHGTGEDASFSTVSHWFEDEWVQDANEVFYQNDKRTGFRPFLNLPQYTSLPLELALGLSADEENERVALQKRGWRVRHSRDVAATPWGYQRYIQESLGEFSCVKPSCIHLQNAWISDRTLCYLASGKPAVVQHTGASQFLPDDAGLFRFRDVGEAVRCLETVAADYDRQCTLARALAEEYFDARKVVASVLERALP